MRYLNGSEILYGFCGWLNSRKSKTIMSSSNKAAPVVDLITDFIEANGLEDPESGWEENLLFPVLKTETATSGNLKEEVIKMMTVEHMINELKKYPSEAKCYAYEGEVIGLVVVDENKEELGYIIAKE